MFYVSANGGPINVFFKLPITEVSHVDDHTRVRISRISRILEPNKFSAQILKALQNDVLTS